MDYGPIMVGSTISKELVLLNDGQCSLHYKLHVEQSIDNTFNSSQFNTDPVGQCEDKHTTYIYIYYSLSAF